MAPSTGPSVSPSVYCADSSLKFEIKDPDGSEYDLKCIWITTIADVRCGYNDVRTHCPVTCGACDPCTDSKAEFYFKTILSTCVSLATNKCKISAIFHTCRATCGSCPSSVPSAIPSNDPSSNPSAIPSLTLSMIPSSVPSLAPSSLPSSIPTVSSAPSSTPSNVPSNSPSTNPSSAPSLLPSVTPSVIPSSSPSSVPSSVPSGSPSTDPSSIPSTLPSVTLSSTPLIIPSSLPSSMPSSLPSKSLSSSPSTIPSVSPSVYCADSSLQFKAQDPNGTEYDLKCIWVTSIADIRCAYNDVRTHCPVTCGACDPCSDSRAEFYFQGILSTCVIANEKKCKRTGIFHTCRATCGNCPSLVPSTAASTEDPTI